MVSSTMQCSVCAAFTIVPTETYLKVCYNVPTGVEIYDVCYNVPTGVEIYDVCYSVPTEINV